VNALTIEGREIIPHVKGWTKLLLDIAMGAVASLLILNNLTRPLDASLAYVLAVLMPVSYVLIDTFVLSRRFNAITTYVASAAIMNGVLAFWFVDGWQYALKSAAGLIVAVGLFFGALLLGRPMFESFAAQVFQPDTPQKDRARCALCARPLVRQSLMTATLIVGAANVMLGAVNFLLSLNIVLAPCGAGSFNAQAAQVNAITRVLFLVVSLGVFAGAFYLVYCAFFQVLPSEAGKSQFESEFWDLARLWAQGGASA
jgi:hypothetical protein